MLLTLAVAWAAQSTLSVAQDTGSTAFPGPVPGRVVIFRCQVRDGTSLTACEPRQDAQLLAGEAPAMIAAIESSRCVTEAAPGRVVERAIESPRPGEPPTAYHVVSFPEWVGGFEKVPEFFPSHAASTGQSGTVTLTCDVLASGTLRNCEAAAETPAGWGFGEAAVKASAFFRFRPKMIDCQPVEGGKVAVPIAFNVE